MSVECVEILTLKECLWIKSYIFYGNIYKDTFIFILILIYINDA